MVTELLFLRLFITLVIFYVLNGSSTSQRYQLHISSPSSVTIYHYHKVSNITLSLTSLTDYKLLHFSVFPILQKYMYRKIWYHQQKRMINAIQKNSIASFNVQCQSDIWLVGQSNVELAFVLDAIVAFTSKYSFSVLCFIWDDWIVIVKIHFRWIIPYWKYDFADFSTLEPFCGMKFGLEAYFLIQNTIT